MPDLAWLEHLADPAVRPDVLTLAAAGRIPPRLIGEAAARLPAALAVPLLDAGRTGHPGSGRLRREHLARLLAARDDDAALAFGRAALATTDDPADAHMVSLSSRALCTEADIRFEELAQDDAACWRMRARRRKLDGDQPGTAAAFARALAFDDPLRSAILAEAAAFAVSRGRYASDRAIVEEAVARGLRDPNEIATAAFLAMPAVEDSPAGAFAQLPHTPAYAPENTLLMVGNSLRLGGMERVLARTIGTLHDRGAFAAIDLALVDPAGAAAPAGTHDLLDLAPRPVTDPVIARLPSAWAGRAQAALDLIRARRPAVVHIWNDQLGLIAGYAALLAGCPRILVHVHHMRPTRDPAEARQSASWPACYRHILDRPALRLAFVSAAAARDYADWWGTASDRFNILYNGLESIPAKPSTSYRERLGIPADAPVLGTLMRFAPVKQPDLWLDAARRVQAELPGVHILIGGDGPLHAAIAEAAAGDPRIHLPGRIDDVPAALAAMDLFMMTSASEGLPTAAIEAQAAGVPLVAFDAGGTAETIIAEVTGTVVPANDVAALARAAAAWLADQPALRAAGQAARDHAARAFSMERYLHDLLALYAD